MAETSSNDLPTKVSWAGAFRDIVVTSMNRGQLPILGVLALVMMLLWKLNEQDAAKLVFQLFEALRAGDLWGYVLLVLSLVGWYLHLRAQRRMFMEETKRIGREKSDLQSQLHGFTLDSSEQQQ